MKHETRQWAGYSVVFWYLCAVLPLDVLALAWMVAKAFGVA